MKNKTFFKKFIPICLISLLFCTLLVPARASESNMQEMVVFSDAGKNGCYRYNEETGMMEFVPPPDYIDEDVPPTPAIGSALIEDDDGISPQWILGKDDRLPVDKPTSQYASTCIIIAHFSNGKRIIGTGWLLDATYVMTAGHLIYDVKYGYGYAQYFDVYVGASGGSYSDYSRGVCALVGAGIVGTTEDEYFTKGIYDDWGVIKLDTPVTVNKDYLGSYCNKNASSMKGTYFTQGYPGDLNTQVAWEKRTMYTAKGSITGDYKFSKPVVYTSIDNADGQSGSPVYSFREGLGYTAEGILIASEPYNANGKTFNCVLLFSNYIYDCVHNLMGK